MTVSDLIARLREMPQDAEVVRNEVTQGYVGVIPVRGPHIRWAVPDGKYYDVPAFVLVDNERERARRNSADVRPVVMIT